MPEIKQIVIKKYPNRRLYNTETSSYITLEELSDLIKKDRNIVVIDAKSGEDLTRITLTQIILEHETKGYSLIPLDFLKQIIKLYDHNMSKTFSGYLNTSMDYFLKNQENIQKFMKSLGKADKPFPNWTDLWEDYTKKNTDFVEKMFKSMLGFDFTKNNDNKDK